MPSHISINILQNTVYFSMLNLKHHRKWVDLSILATSYLGTTLPERPWEQDCTLVALCAALRPLCLGHDYCSHAPARSSSLMSMPFLLQLYVRCSIRAQQGSDFSVLGYARDKMNTLSFLRQTFCHPFRAVGWYVFINVSHNRSHIQL